jgi:nucleotide-binding universal stress UspA family protein
MIKSILVALDTSERAIGVFDAGADLARRFAASLRLLRVVELPPDIPPAGATHGDPAPAQLTRTLTKELVDLSRRATGVTFEAPVIAFGRPWREVLQTASKLDVDLIVIGSHGYHGWDRVLGTTASRVANLADRHVMVIHDRQKHG